MASGLQQNSAPEFPQCYLIYDAQVHVITAGGPQDRAILSLYPGLALISFEGDCTPEPVSIRIKELIAAGHLPAIKSVLLDFSRFTGTIDWEFAKRKKGWAWSETTPEKCAYVARDNAGAMIAKGLAAFAGETECGIFLNYAEAFHWLGWDESASGFDDFDVVRAAS